LEYYLLVISFHLLSFVGDFEGKFLQMLLSSLADIIFSLLQIFGTTCFLVVLPSVSRQFYLMFDLGIIVLAMVLQVLFKISSHIFPTNSSSSPQHLHLVTKTRIFANPLISIIHSLKVTGKPPLWWNHLSLKRGE